jgi:16S rRNA (guanine527-N7)-methyltransferase
MFHGKHPTAEDLPPVVHRAAAWAGLDITDDAAVRLVQYHDWLCDEAITAGGLGPAEASRVWERHIADSLICGFAWNTAPPPAMADLGSGVGLPGIPLAIVFPTTEVTLIDRSGRRCTLLRRVARILDLPITVLEADLAANPAEWGRFPAIVSRATFPASDVVTIAPRLLESGGIAVIPIQRDGPRPSLAAPPEISASIVEVPPNVLDATVWLLRMQTRDDYTN